MARAILFTAAALDALNCLWLGHADWWFPAAIAALCAWRRAGSRRA